MKHDKLMKFKVVHFMSIYELLVFRRFKEKVG